MLTDPWIGSRRLWLRRRCGAAMTVLARADTEPRPSLGPPWAGVVWSSPGFRCRHRLHPLPRTQRWRLWNPGSQPFSPRRGRKVDGLGRESGSLLGQPTKNQNPAGRSLSRKPRSFLPLHHLLLVQPTLPNFPRLVPCHGTVFLTAPRPCPPSIERFVDILHSQAAHLRALPFVL